MDFQHGYIDVKGTRIHLLVANNFADSWLIFFPGLGATAEQFIAFLRDGNKHNVNVIALDPPGHGLSRSWGGEYSQSSIGSIWKAIIDKYDINRTIIGGHSYGACCTLIGDTHLMDEVQGVILFDGAYFGPEDQTVEEVRTQNRQFIDQYVFNTWDDFISDVRASSKAWNDDVELMNRSQMREDEGQIRLRIDLESSVQASLLINGFSPANVKPTSKPVVLLRATQPQELNPERVEATQRLARNLPNLLVVTVPDSGHDVIWDNPKFTQEATWQFVDATFHRATF